MNLNHPVVARLNPAQAPSLAGFDRYRLAIGAGLPTPLAIAIRGSDAALVLVLPSGRIRAWAALDATVPIAAGADQRSLQDSASLAPTAFVAARQRTAPYLMVFDRRTLADRWPLVIGARHVLGRGAPDSRVAIAEIVILDFCLAASAVTVAKPAGCWIDLAIRPLSATDAFNAPMSSVVPIQTGLEQRASQSTRPVAFDIRFNSTLGGASAPDGTPIGGINWWLTHGNR